MTTQLDQFSDERIARYLQNRLGQDSWKVDEAKTQLSKIMREANEGNAQLIGKKTPVLMIGLEELEEMMRNFQEPETWGEYFASVNDIDSDLELHRPTGKSQAAFDIEADYVSTGKPQFVHRDVKPGRVWEPEFNPPVMSLEKTQQALEEARTSMEDAVAYMEVGDNEAAKIVISYRTFQSHETDQSGMIAHGDGQVIGRSVQRKPHKAHFISFVESHPIGTKVEARVIGVRRPEGLAARKLHLRIGGGVDAVAYCRPRKKAFTKGDVVHGVIVRTDLKGHTVSVSLNAPAAVMKRASELRKSR